MLKIFAILLVISLTAWAEAQSINENAGLNSGSSIFEQGNTRGALGSQPRTIGPGYALRPEFGNDVAWDSFNHRGAVVWMCRDIRTEKFVPPKFCAHKDKTDSKWPGKEVPSTFVAEYLDD